MKRSCLVAAGLVLATACSSGSGSPGPKQPAESAFTEGTCRTAAPDVLTIGREVRNLGTGKEASSEPLARMTEAQARLDTVANAAEPAIEPALRKLVTAVGLVRLRSQTGSYTASLGTDVSSAYDAVLAVCTSSSS